MFWQMNCHLHGVFIKELKLPTASKYTIGGFTEEEFTQVTTSNVYMLKIIKLKIKKNNTIPQVVIKNKYALCYQSWFRLKLTIKCKVHKI
jgi:hypothetical protein